MCPVANCMATACVGQRFVDKQPLACGVETALSDVGTAYALEFVVFNSAGMSARVQRTIVVASPCGAGEFLCGDACSKVSAPLAGGDQAPGACQAMGPLGHGATDHCMGPQINTPMGPCGHRSTNPCTFQLHSIASAAKHLSRTQEA